VNIACKGKVEIFISSERKIMFIIYLLTQAILQFINERVRLMLTAILMLVRCDMKLLSGNLVKQTDVLHGCFQHYKPMLKLYYTDFYF